MPKGVKKTAVQKQLENLEYLQSAGLAIPEVGLEFLREQRRIEEGVYEVLACACGERLEMYVPTSLAICRCGKNLKSVWKNEHWLRSSAQVEAEVGIQEMPQHRTRLDLRRSSGVVE